MELKVATLDDLDLIERMGVSFLEASKYSDVLSKETIRSVAELIISSDVKEKIILLHGEVGMLVAVTAPLFFFGPKTALEVAWWVEPEHRKSKIGQELMEAFEYWAKNVAGCSFVTMDCQDDVLDKVYKERGYKLYSMSYMKEL